MSLQKIWPVMRWLLLVTAIANQAFYLQSHHRITYDEMLQIGAAHSLARGDGLVLRRATVENLARSVGQPLVERGWPAAYALGMSGIHSLIGDMGRADYVLKIFATCVFFVSWFVILELLKDVLGYRARFSLAAFWALIFSPLMVPQWTAHTTGMLSLAFFSAGICLVSWSLEQKGSLYLSAGTSGMLIGLAMSLRYAYVPLGIVVPLGLCCLGIMQQDIRRNLILAAIANGLTAGAVWGGIQSYNYFEFDNILPHGWPPSVGRGFFPQNVLAMIPFPAHVMGFMSESYFGTRGVTKQISMPGLIPNVLTGMFSLIVLATFVIVSYHVLTTAKSSHNEPSEKPKGVSWFIFFSGVVTVIVTVGFLTAISVLSEMRHVFGGTWTYVSELRYFAPTLPFFALCVAVMIFRGKDSFSSKTNVALRGILLTFTVFALWTVGFWRLNLAKQQIMNPRTFHYGVKSPLGTKHPLVTAYHLARAQGLLVEGVPFAVVRAKEDKVVEGPTLALGGIDVPVESLSLVSEFSTHRPIGVFIVRKGGLHGENETISHLQKKYGLQKLSETINRECYFFFLDARGDLAGKVASTPQETAA